jgi:hypothetical protein
MHNDMVLLSHHPVSGEPADEQLTDIARLKATAAGEPVQMRGGPLMYWQPFDGGTGGGHRRVCLDSMATVCRVAGYTLRLIHNG